MAFARQCMESISDFWTLITCMFPSTRNNYSVLDRNFRNCFIPTFVYAIKKDRHFTRANIMGHYNTDTHTSRGSKKVSTIFTLYVKAKATIKRLTINPHFDTQVGTIKKQNICNCYSQITFLKSSLKFTGNLWNYSLMFDTIFVASSWFYQSKDTSKIYCLHLKY